MKKQIIVVLIIAALGAFCMAQEAKAPFDVKKSQSELEIMKGILSTTIQFVAKNYQKDVSRYSFSNIYTYYLVGQGAMFIIPTSQFSPIQINLSQSPFGADPGNAILIDAAVEQNQEQVRLSG